MDFEKFECFNFFPIVIIAAIYTKINRVGRLDADFQQVEVFFQKEEGFFQQLQVLRQEQMGPLSAASMEIGSYQRGYEYIVR